jgi:hypothetical protein
MTRHLKQFMFYEDHVQQLMDMPKQVFENNSLDAKHSFLAVVETNFII